MTMETWDFTLGRRGDSTAQRIAAARERAGLSPEAMAHGLGLTVPSYYDLEAYDDEAFMCISVAQLRSLARILGISARDLVSSERSSPTIQTVTPAELVRRMKEQIVADGVDVESFSTKVGWDVAAIVADPEALWDAWCLDELQAICRAVGVDWLAVLPLEESVGAG